MIIATMPDRKSTITRELRMLQNNISKISLNWHFMHLCRQDNVLALALLGPKLSTYMWTGQCLSFSTIRAKVVYIYVDRTVSQL